MLKGQYWKSRKKHVKKDVPSTEMVIEIPRSPSVCAQRKNKISEKVKIVKGNL